MDYNFNYQSVVDKNASLSFSSQIGKGTVIMTQCAVNSDAVIADHCIINCGAVIGHDCMLESFVHISGRSYLSGHVTDREGTHIGIGSNIIPGIKIGKWVTIGAGSVITRDIPDYATVVGNPGRIIKVVSAVDNDGYANY